MNLIIALLALFSPIWIIWGVCKFKQWEERKNVS